MTDECVRVVVRCRPMNTREKNLNCKKIVAIDKPLLQIGISKPSPGGKQEANNTDYDTKRFTFDNVYDEDCTQREVYDETAYSLVQSVLEGYNGTIFAYGQTGCGKTFSMEGVRSNPELRGIIPNSFDQVFNEISVNSNPKKQYLVRASYIEIYNEEVRDLMSSNPKARCEVKEDPERGVFIKGVTNTEVTTVEQLNILMDEGNKNRTVGATLMNADSSRSHSIFTVTIETAETVEMGGGEEVKIKQGKLNLVDLAGSERQTKTKAEGQRLKEAAQINLSLSALGNVIEALVKIAGGAKKLHIPYRDSKLTRLLQDSLGGNTKTIMIAAISPAEDNYEETLSTLRYANRAKNIKNKPKINEDPKDAMLREYQSEIARLKKLLEERGLGDLLNEAKALAGPAKPSSAKPPATAQAAASAAAAAAGAATALVPHPPPPKQSPTSQARSLEEKAADDALNAAVGTGAAEVMSSQEKKEWFEQQREMQEDMNRLGEEKLKHENMARILEEQMKTEMAAEIQTRVQQEIADHELRAKELAQEMEQRLADEKSKLEAIKQKAKNQQETLKNKLAKLQQKLLSGSQKVKDMKAEQEEKWRAAKLAEQEMRQKQARLQEEKQLAEEAKLLLEEEYASAKDELAGKSRKLKQLQKKYTALQDEIKDNESQWENEKAGYLDNIRDIYRELRLYKQICETFLTSSDIEKIVKNSQFEEGRDMWILPKMDLPVLFPSIRVSAPAAGSAMGNSNSAIAAARRGSLMGGATGSGGIRDRPANGGNSGNLKQRGVDSADNGADAGWKKSVVAQISQEELGYSKPSNGRPFTGNRGVSSTPKLSPAPAVAMSESDLEVLTGSIKRRSVFEPLGGGLALSVETKEADPNDPLGSLPRRANFSPATAVIPETAPVQTGPIDIANIDAGLRKRTPFEPAAHLISQPGSGLHSPSPDPLVSAALPPRRPAFQPAQLGPDSVSPGGSAFSPTSPGSDIDDILSRAPRGRATFQPASLQSPDSGGGSNPVDDILSKTAAIPMKPKFEPAIASR